MKVEVCGGVGIDGEVGYCWVELLDICEKGIVYVGVGGCW